MRVRLLRDARIRHSAGEIVMVSPAEAAFLTSTGSAVHVADDQPQAVEPAPAAQKKTAAKKTNGEKTK